MEKQQFLCIFDNEIVRVTSVDEGTLQAATDGFVTIVDISNPIKPLHYCNEHWKEIEEFTEET